MMIGPLRSLLCTSLLVAARPAAAQVAANPDVVAVKATLTAMWAAIEQGDSAAYARHVHPDFTQFGENDVYLAKGREAEVRSMGSYLRRAKEVHTDMHQAEVTVRGGVAWITYYWTDSGYSEGKRFTSRGKSTRIFVKEGDRWLCIHGHYTAVP
jgi:ketosteroid isomerase-like protein